MPLTRVAALIRATPWLRYTLVTVAFTIVAAAMTWPHLRYFGSSILGGGGDVPAGIRYLWGLDEQGGDPFTTRRDLLLGAPEGTPILRAANVGNFLFVGTVWLLGHAVGWIVAMNVYNFAGLVLAGTAAYVLLEKLRFGVVAAVFGAYVFAFNPNHIEKAMGHVPLAATWILPAVLLSLLAKRAQPTAAWSCLAGVLVGVAFYLNSYLGLFAIFLAGIFALTELFLRREGSTLYEVARSYYFAAGAGTVALTPLAISLYLDRSAVSTFTGERAKTLVGGYGTPELYLLPSPRHPVFGGRMSDWLETHLSWEYTMFFGYTTLSLALVGVGLGVVRWRRNELTRERGFLLVFASLLTLVGLWASAPPALDVFGLNVPTPTAVLQGSVFRVFSRFGVLVALGLILLAGYALSSLPRRPLGATLASLAVVVVAFELYVPAPRPIAVQDAQAATSVAELAAHGSGRPELLSLRETPSYLDWLREQPRGRVLDYPTPNGSKSRWAWQDDFFQYYHHQPLWYSNGRRDRVDVEDFVSDLERPRVSDILAGAGVEYVVLHRERYRALGVTPPQSLCGLTHLARFAEGDVSIYRVSAVGISNFVSRGQGFFDAGSAKVWPESKGFRWMGSKGSVLIYAPGPQEVFLTGVALSFNRPRRLDVYNVRGENVGQWEILPSETSFRFLLRVEGGVNRLEFRATPGGEVRGARGKGSDSRLVSMAFQGLAVTPTDPKVAAAAARASVCDDDPQRSGEP